MGVWVPDPASVGEGGLWAPGIKARLWSGSRIGSPRRADQRNGRQRGLATSFRQQHNQRGLPHCSCSGQGPLHYQLPSSFALPGCDENTSRAPGPPPHTTYITAGAREGPSPPITERPLQLFHLNPPSTGTPQRGSLTPRPPHLAGTRRPPPILPHHPTKKGVEPPFST